MKRRQNRPGDEEGDGGRQKSQSGDRSHMLPPQLSGELEDSEPGDKSLVPGDNLSALALTSSKLGAHSVWALLSDVNSGIKFTVCKQRILFLLNMNNFQALFTYFGA